MDPDQALNFKERLQTLLADRPPKIVLDCSDLRYTGSAGLREFFFASKAAEQAGGKLVLCSLSADVQKTFEIAGFANPENIFTSREKALAAF